MNTFAPKNDLHPPNVSFAKAVRVWARVGCLSFGGPAGQIALMHKVLVEERRWIGEARFLHALSYCMLLPGPEAQQLATYIGWLMHRTKGGLAAGFLFVLPGFLAILFLSILYASFREVKIVDAVFFGLKAAVLAIVVDAVIRVGKKALKKRRLYAVAFGAFVALFFFRVPFPVVVLLAAAIGFLGARWFSVDSVNEADNADDHRYVVDSQLARSELGHTRPSRRRAVLVCLLGVAFWVGPLLLLSTALGPAHVFTKEALFFSKAAVVTFGGAYAVLAYVAQKAVAAYAWLTPSQMIDGLGLAETTPGPLIMVVEFVGFMGAYKNPGDLPPLLAGVLGACVTVWVTFVPCFFWIFLGGPYVESLRKNVGLRAALSVVTAAVVGVIANLSFWFFVHATFGRVREVPFGLAWIALPEWSTLNIPMVVLAGLAMLALFRFKLGMGKTLAASALLGAAWRWWSP